MAAEPESPRSQELPPLTGVRVIDVSQALAAPFCAMQLGDFGAEVIKIEPPEGDMLRNFPPMIGELGKEQSLIFLLANRNKKGMVLDYKQPEGREILDRLLENADIVVTNNRRLESMEEHGFGKKALEAINSRAIIIGVSAYGHTGPYRGLPGYDLLAQAGSGSMSLTGNPENDFPYRYPSPIADIATAVKATLGTTLALLRRNLQGYEGVQFIDVSLMESHYETLMNLMGIALNTDKPLERRGNNHPSVAPYGVFQAGDREMVVGVATEKRWKSFCESIGRKELINDPRFSTNTARVENVDELTEIIEAVLQTRSAEEWLEGFQGQSIPCSLIATVEEALVDPQFLARGGVWEINDTEVGTIKTLANQFQRSFPLREISPPPRLGEHTDVILKSLDFSTSEIGALRSKRVVE